MHVKIGYKDFGMQHGILGTSRQSLLPTRKSDDRISTIFFILPNEFLCISDESRGKPRNFRFPNAN